MKASLLSGWTRVSEDPHEGVLPLSAEDPRAEASEDAVEVLRASNADVDIHDPRTARDEAEAIVARAAEEPALAAIGKGLFNTRYGDGSMEGFAAAGLFVFKPRQSGHVFLFELAGRDAMGLPDAAGARVLVNDAGTNVQVKQKPPCPELLAQALVETARLKGWPAISIDSNSELANKVRQHIVAMGMRVAQPGGGGTHMEPKQRAAPTMG